MIVEGWLEFDLDMRLTGIDRLAVPECQACFCAIGEGEFSMEG